MSNDEILAAAAGMVNTKATRAVRDHLGQLARRSDLPPDGEILGALFCAYDKIREAERAMIHARAETLRAIMLAESVAVARE
jgi:hypothetical protein